MILRGILTAIFPVLFLASCMAPCHNYKRNPPVGWELREVIGKGLFVESTYIEEPDLGNISHIVQGTLDANALNALVIVGWNKAIYLDDNKRNLKTVGFNLKGVRIIATDLENDGRLEFINKGGAGGPVFIFDDQGNRRWSYGSISGTNGMASGDINGDGKTEYVVGSDEGILIFDSNFNKLREEPESLVWQVETVDINGDGKAEIVHNNASGCLKVRDWQGREVGLLNVVPYVAHFSLCTWPTKDSTLHFLVNSEEKNVLFDLKGDVVAQYDAPWSAEGMAVGTPVRFNKENEPYFAVVDEIRATWKRSILYIYSPERKLIYQEIIPASIASLYALPSESSDEEILLVGGEGIVWQYKLTDEIRREPDRQ